MNSRIYPHPFFAKEGQPIIIGVGVVALLLALIGWHFLSGIAVILFIFCAQFFRDPARELPEDPRAVVSPADGRICKVQKAVDPLTGAECTMVSIFMNVFNVHSQKSPVAGTIEEIVYTPGLFVNADLDKASTDNERNAVRVKMEDGRSITFVQVAGLIARRIICHAEVGVNADLDKASTDNERNAVRVKMEDGRSITFVQVAGLIARRIICHAEVGQKLERGERYGFIRFGSRVDMYLPTDAEICVSIGDKVTGVMTTIARL